MNLKKTLILIIIFMICIYAIYSDESKKQGLKVTLLISSGMPNPSYMINEPDKIKAIQQFFKNKAREKAINKLFEAKLGDNGMQIENTGNISDIPECFIISENEIFIINKISSNSRSSMSVKQNVISDKNKNLVNIIAKNGRHPFKTVKK